MADFTLESMSAMLLSIGAAMPQVNAGALEQAALVVENKAKKVIGTYAYGWPELADATQAARGQAGYPENEPLLVTGEMRDSIGHVVGNNEASVGSNEDKAVWQELGTSRGIPPRSFLAESARRSRDEVEQIIGQAVYESLLVGGPAFPHITPSAKTIP